MKYVSYAAWTIAVLATAGSLSLGWIFHLAPCDLCWYQRVFMFPLTIILGIGILRRDTNNATTYALPLAIAGAVVAAYHSLLQWGIIHQAILPCVSTIPCATKQINWLGFITIPFMSLLAFALIIFLLLLTRRTKPVLDAPATSRHE